MKKNMLSVKGLKLTDDRILSRKELKSILGGRILGSYCVVYCCPDDTDCENVLGTTFPITSCTQDEECITYALQIGVTCAVGYHIFGECE